MSMRKGDGDDDDDEDRGRMCVSMHACVKMCVRVHVCVRVTIDGDVDYVNVNAQG